MIGKTLAHYKITGQLGKGGMGAVYQAEDQKLGRDVAIKVLPEEFAKDANLAARFQREAKVLASLNHSNIAAVYGLEESSGTNFLVLELVEGETLEERLKRGPISIEESLKLALQIVEAMEAAHEKGVIHRDLKPANIKVTPNGKVKVLDFGLAKDLTGKTRGLDASQSATITGIVTSPGLVLGTAAYMSPEQAKGKSVDRRTDIWALGCILYECLSGRRAFQGGTVIDTVAAILTREPDWQALPETTPSSVHFVVRRCLVKDLDRRFHDAADVRIEIEEARSLTPLSTGKTGIVSETRAGWRRAFPPWLMLIAALLGIVGGWMLKPSPSRPVARLTVLLPSGDVLGDVYCPSAAFSPDGNQLVYVAIHRNTQQLYIRPVDSIDATVIPGTEGAKAPFYSPDGKWIGFFGDGKLKKVSVNGGSVQTLCDAPIGLGGTWGPDDAIYFAPFSVSGIWKVSSVGGRPQQVTRLDRSKGEVSHRWPEMLPGGKAMLFTMWTGPGWDEQQIAVYSFQDGQKRVLVPGGSTGRFVSTGHLVYSHAGQLMALPLDPAGLQVASGPAVPLGEVVNEFEGANFAVSQSGSLAWVSPTEQSGNRRLVWVDRAGKAELISAPPNNYMSVRLSPDGRQLATGLEGPTEEVWIYDFSRLTLTRLTSEQGSSQWPIWTPDGRRIVYRGTRSGFRNLYWKASNGGGTEERLTSGESSDTAWGFSPDGRSLVYTILSGETGYDIWELHLDGERKTEALLKNRFDEGPGMISPDGKLMAYMSNESGRNEIYVQPFPGPGGKWQVSIDGGTQPLWNRNGREIFYRNGDKMMSVPITTRPNFAAGAPRLLFVSSHAGFPTSGHSYDVSPDGRFLMIKGDAQDQSLTQINIVLNWTEELKQRVLLK